MNPFIKRYNAFQRPLLPVLLASICAYGVFLLLAFCLSLQSGLGPQAKATAAPAPFFRLVFQHGILLAYISLYCGMWGLYLAAPSFKKSRISFVRSLGQIQSLRRLLLIASWQWKDYGHSLNSDDAAKPPPAPRNELKPQGVETNKLPCDAEVDALFKDKSQSSMGQVAILAAASVLVLDKISDILINNTQLPSALHDAFHLALLKGAFASAAYAFLCFIVAADDFDTVHNRWRRMHDGLGLSSFFYLRAVRPRFAGLGALALGICLTFAYLSEALGLLGLGISFSVFYHHLFPRIPATTDWPSRMLCGTLIIAPFVLEPLGMCCSPA